MDEYIQLGSVGAVMIMIMELRWRVTRIERYCRRCGEYIEEGAVRDRKK